MKIFKIFVLFAACLSATVIISAQQSGSGIALAPARIELEMPPGTEQTLVINLDYHSSDPAAKSSRIVANLNDWSINKDGQVEFYPSGSQARSAGAWLAYSPTEAVVSPNSLSSIRVTVAVPFDAKPGDYLTALIIEQRPENLKLATNQKQINLKYRMAAVVYVKVPQLIKRGTLAGLTASYEEKRITVIPTLKNEGNTALRPNASIRIKDADGKIVAELLGYESLPVLAGKELNQPISVEKILTPGKYQVSFRIDFNDGKPATEGTTSFTVKNSIIK